MSLENIQWYLKSFNELRNDELYDILALRAQIFVVEQFCPYADADGDDKSTLHLICKSADDSILAYSRIIHPGLHYPEASIGRIITSETARGTGLGSELMKRSIQAVESEYGKVAIKNRSAVLFRRLLWEVWL